VCDQHDERLAQQPSSVSHDLTCSLEVTRIERMLFHHSWIQRGVAVLASVGVALTVAASATASRAPTPGERAAIARAARGTPHAAGTGPVQVSDIRVSTVGPWATAQITVHVGHEPDSALDILRYLSGQWRLTKRSPGTAAVSCGIGMPLKDQRNLQVVCTPERNQALR
jgi:hypothetical protein